MLKRPGTSSTVATPLRPRGMILLVSVSPPAFCTGQGGRRVSCLPASRRCRTCASSCRRAAVCPSWPKLDRCHQTGSPLRCTNPAADWMAFCCAASLGQPCKRARQGGRKRGILCTSRWRRCKAAADGRAGGAAGAGLGRASAEGAFVGRCKACQCRREARQQHGASTGEQGEEDFADKLPRCHPGPG